MVLRRRNGGNRLLPLFILILAAASGLTGAFARDSSSPVQTYLPSARMTALGGPHAALADDFSTLFNNPAGFNLAEPELSIAEITAHLSGPVFDIFSVIASGTGGGAESVLLSPSVQSLMQGLNATLGLLGPVAFGYVGNGLGLGLFTSTNVAFANSAPLILSAAVSEQLTICGGYAFHLPIPEESGHALDFGILLKGILRGELIFSKSFLEFPTLFANFSVDTFLSEPFIFTSGIGFDLGVRYAYKDLFAVGIAARDIYTPTLINTYTSVDAFLNGTEQPVASNGLVPFDFSVGVEFSPTLGFLSRFITDFKVLLDYNDMFDFLLNPGAVKHPILHLGLGLELTMLDILSLRGGFYQGLFAAGLGIDITVFTLNLSMYGSELSSEPGLNPAYNIMLGLEFRL